MDKNLADHLLNLEASGKDQLGAELKNLQFTRVEELKVSANKKVYIIFVPYIFRKSFQKIQIKLTRELSKKFSGADVLFVAERVILPRSFIRRKGNQQRPRSRTLSAVHEAFLEDICYPTAIVGKRTRCSADGKRVMKIYLNPRDAKDNEEKRDTLAAVYKKFCNKTARFVVTAESQ